MNLEDFISLNGVKWGAYPYYYGDNKYVIGNYNKEEEMKPEEYDKYIKKGKGLIYFATFGCKKAFQYNEFYKGTKYIDTGQTTREEYFSLYHNGFPNHYGDGLFQKNNSLTKDDDFIRNNNAKIAIPTEKELKYLLNNSDFTLDKKYFIIHPYEKNDKGEKEYKGEIHIPFLGMVNYVGNNLANITEYKVESGSMKPLGLGSHVEFYEKDWKGTPPPDFPFVIVETRYASNGLSSYNIYKCYEYGFYYSDIYLLTSDIPKDKENADKGGETYAHVLHIYIKVNIDDDQYGDPEFISFEIDTDSDGEPRIDFENIKCCEGKNSTHQDRGFMVLPIRYDDNITIEMKGGLLLNEEEFSSYNQETGETESYFVIEPFGIPAITKGNYDYDFKHDLIGTYPISTSFLLPNGSKISIKDFKSYSYIEDKIKVVSNTNKSYWIVSNNECLYIKETSANTYNLIFDDRPLFFEQTKSGITHTTILYIDTNIDYQGQYTVDSDRFVLPSIYKPFYIKRIYSIDRFEDDENDAEYYYGIYTSVYNGIGLFAHKGERTSNVSSIPNDLKTKLNSYFNNDDTFSKYFEWFYEYEGGKYDDIYVVGYTNDKIVLSTSDNDNTVEIDDFALPIYRKRPLILSDYNNSVFEFLDNYPYGINAKHTLRTHVSTVEFFKSVEEPKTKMPFNKNKSGGIMNGSTNVNFGGIDIGSTSKTADLFGKAYVSFINGIIAGDSGTGDSGTTNEVLAKYISEGRENGIRYYLVNYAFYSNYINYAYPNMSNTTEDYFSNFIKYNEEYYKNREYYDLNPHLVDFRDSDKWYITTDTKRFEATDEYLEFYLVPKEEVEKQKLKVDSYYVEEINGKDTLFVEVNKNSTIYYNVVSDIKEIESTEVRYRASFWILNSDYATIRVRVNLGDYKNIEDFSSFEDETIGNVPYRIFIIKPGEKRYLEFVGYPFIGESVKVWIGPEYKNTNNEYYQIKFSITTVTLGEVAHILPFFDMIPALKNTNGYVYSDKRIPNVNAPMAIELYTYSGQTGCRVEFVKQRAVITDDTEEVDDSTFLIGVYSNLTKLYGPCCDADRSLSGYTESNNIYCNQIQNGTEILPQNNNITIIYCYGYTRGYRSK